MDLPTFRRLLGPEGHELMAAAAAAADDDLALGSRLRRTHDADLVAAAVTQVRLRAKARGKLGDDAARMYFTPDALEQSTRAPVSRLRAERLASSADRVVDLGCGIGGDLVAFARAGLAARGIERDPVRAEMARANLSALGLDGEVVAGDLADVTIADDEVPFLDPARRSGAGRVFDPAAMEPPWHVVLEHLRGRAVVKTLPGLSHALVPDDVEAQWVSDCGDLVEACLWGPGLAEVPRRATALPGRHEVSGTGEPGDVGAVGGWLHEPDDAVIRSGLVGELAGRMGGRLVDGHIAYVTTDNAVTDPLARSFRVEAQLPFREKQLRAALRERGVGTLTVKKRGVDVVPEQLVQRLRLRGDVTATVVMTRVAGEGRAFLVDPVTAA